MTYVARSSGPAIASQTTALVHEAYLRLVDYERMQSQNRSHLSRRTLDKRPWSVALFWGSRYVELTGNAKA